MPTDLVLLVADKNTEYGLRGLLSRPEALGIRPITWKAYVHPQRDPACAGKAHEFLRSFARDYHRALVVFDHHGSGRENRSAVDLESDVEQLLAINGWTDRAHVVAIAPELESWVFTSSPQVEACIQWPGPARLRNWLQSQGHWSEVHTKPKDPKAALEAALARVRRPRSSSIYECLGRSVGFETCNDRAFVRLRQILQTWFPIGESPTSAAT